MSEDILASRLTYLPLFLPRKIELWLTHKNIKPVSMVILGREKHALTQKHLKRIYQWLADAGLKYKISPKSDTETTTLVVSNDINKIDEFIKLSTNITDESEYKFGLLLGYPQKAVHTYVYNYSILAPVKPEHLLANKYPEYHYLGYRIRANHESEDLETAKLWMETIRQDLPKIAHWFEAQTITVGPKKQKTQIKK